MTQPNRPNAVLAFVRARWFLCLMLALIPIGFAFGRSAPGGGGDVGPYAGYVVAGVLFLMSLTLNSRALAASIAKPLPVLWACAVCLLVMPGFAWFASRWQLSEDFRLELAAVASVPCTMAAASVWTRRAGGNDAVSLLTTLLTNGLCFAYTPWLLVWLAGQSVEMDARAMAVRLVYTALMPAAAGQASRLLLSRFVDVDRLKTALGVVAQSGILLIIFGSSFKAGGQLTSAADLGGGAAIAVLTASCVAVHLAAAAAAWWGGRAIGLSKPDATATVFAGSQKTLPIAMLVVTDPAMLGGSGIPLAPVPVLLYHAMQLFVDTLIADRMARTVNAEDRLLECRSKDSRSRD